jgi:hypothetical protein
MTIRLCIAVLLGSVLLCGCRAQPVSTTSTATSSEAADAVARLDRGSWMVNKRSRVWKILKADSRQGTAPLHVGYLKENKYRQMRGGPAFQMYTVTSLHQDEQLGHIDTLGRAVRYEARRNGTFEEVSVGTGSLELSVAAILDTPERITLEKTDTRSIAFAALDTNGNGTLEADEIAAHGGLIRDADSNGDGIVDYQEFSALDSF